MESKLRILISDDDKEFCSQVHRDPARLRV